MTSSSNDRGRPPVATTLLKLLGVLLVTGVLAAGVLLPYLGGLGLAGKHEAEKFLDEPCNLVETTAPIKTTFYASDGKTPIASIFKQDRSPVSLSQVPTYLVKALVDTEDRRFYSHHGVDLRGLIRSALNTSSGDTQGGSTLTMQYVKQVRYYQAGDDPVKQQEAIDQNIDRKIEDAKCAIQLEKTNSKDQILEKYLNIAFFGENSYGIGTAAETFFHKTPSQLTVPEAALLVGALKAPSQYDPFFHYKDAQDRRNEVLQNMVTAGDLSPADAAKDEATPISLYTKVPQPVQEGCTNANPAILNVGFFCDYAERWLENTAGISPVQLSTGGLQVRTTLNPTLQNTMQRGLQTSMPATSPMTAIMPAVDPTSGNVIAMASSKFYGLPSSSTDQTHTMLPIFDTTTTGSASTYKYFTLLAALKAGLTPSYPIYTPTSGYTTKYCPNAFNVTNNDANSFFTPTETMSSAIAKSSNTYFVGLEDEVFNCQLTPMVNTALSLGMNALKQPVSAGSPLTTAQAIIAQGQSGFTLGNNETSPLELTGAYAASANSGVFCAPAPVISITDANGKPIPLKGRGACAPQLSPQVARTAVGVLTGDTLNQGTTAGVFSSFYAAHPGSLVAGKTGTNVAVPDTDNSSLWFVGMTPRVVATTAVINLAQPNAPAAGLPGFAGNDAATQAYGEFAAQLWLDALGPSIGESPWTWPSPTDIPGGVAVQSVVGQPMESATAALVAQGFKVADYSQLYQTSCASSVAPGSVAFEGPMFAAPGSTITLCPSTGAQIDQPPAPPKPRTTPPPSTGVTTPGGTGGATTPAPGTGIPSLPNNNTNPPGRGGGNG